MQTNESFAFRIELSKKGLIKIGKSVLILFFLFGFTYFSLQYLSPVFGDLLPGSGPFRNQTDDMMPTWVNITRGHDLFYADGNQVFITANFTCTSPHVCNESMTANANFSGIGESAGNRTGVFRENGTAPGQTWTLFEFNGTVNISNITGVTLPLLVHPATIVLFGTDGNGSAEANPFNSTVLIVNMSVLPSCPPAGTQLPPKMPLLNGTLVPAGADTLGACITTCSGDDRAEQNSTGDWNMCGINFGGDTTNFTQVADTGNFSNFPFVIDIPGKAKINFTTNVSMDTQAKAQALFEFAMKNVMSGGRIGVNESEWDGSSKPNLTLSARLTVYNFSDRFGVPAGSTPSISRRATFGSGSFGACGDSCSDIEWDGENITFTVSSFSEYEITNGLGMVADSPSNQSYFTSRNVNFTFTPTWNDTVNPTNVSLFLNISGTWGIPLNTTSASNSTNQSSLVNNTINGINYTFSEDGHYLWNTRIYDTTGGSDANSINWSVIVDTAAPSIDIKTPSKGTYYENQVTLKFSASDTEGIGSCNYQIDGGTKVTANRDKDILLSNLANGPRKITVNCDDNAKNNASASVTVSISASSGSTDTGTSAVTTPVISKPADEKVRAFVAKINADQRTTIPIDQGDVSGISLTVKNTVTSVYVDISSLETKPAEVSEPPSGKVFKYLDITPSGLGTGDIEKASIEFKVEKAWISANKIDSDSVLLLRFADGVWNELNTTKVAETDEHVTYEADTPGFSFFAISGKETSEVPAEESSPTIPSEEKAPATEAPTAESALTPDTSVIILVVVIAIVVFVAIRGTNLRKIFKK